MTALQNKHYCEHRQAAYGRRQSQNIWKQICRKQSGEKISGSARGLEEYGDSGSAIQIWIKTDGLYNHRPTLPSGTGSDKA